MPALHVAQVLTGLLAAVAAVLALLLWRRAAASGGAWRGVVRTLIQRGAALLALGLFVAAADALLPAGRVATTVHHLEALDGDAVEVAYPLCCTAGDMAGCEAARAPWLQPGQAVVVRRTRLLGRCTVERAAEASPCHCT